MAASKHKVFDHFTDTDLNFYIRDGVGNVKYIYFYLKVDQIPSDAIVKHIVNLIIKEFPNNFTGDSEKGKIAYTINFGGVYTESLFKEATKFVNDYLVSIGYKDTKIQRNKTQKTTTAVQTSNSNVLAGSLVGLKFKTKSADTIYEITKEDAKNVDLSWKDRNGVYGNTQMGLKETLNFINNGTYIIVETPKPIAVINSSSNNVRKNYLEVNDIFIFTNTEDIYKVLEVDTINLVYKCQNTNGFYTTFPTGNIKDNIEEGEIIVLSDINQELKGLQFETSNDIITVTSDVDNGVFVTFLEQSIQGTKPTQTSLTTTLAKKLFAEELFNEKFKFILSSAKNLYKTTATPTNAIPQRTIQSGDYFVFINSGRIYFVQSVNPYDNSVTCIDSNGNIKKIQQTNINSHIETKNVLVLNDINQPLSGLDFENGLSIFKVKADGPKGDVEVQSKVKSNGNIDTQEYSRATFVGVVLFKYHFELIPFSRTSAQQPAETPIVTQTAIAPTDDRQIELAKLKTNLSDLIIIKSFINEWDFEERVNVSTLIDKSQKKINDLNFLIIESFSSQKQMLDDLFEQSFTPILPRYDDILRKGVEDNFSPNGQPSDLSESINQLTKTGAFKEWFGDWENAYFYRNIEGTKPQTSGVLSNNFEPLLVWHGTGAQFSYFKFDNFPAVYFAANRAYSEFFAVNQSKDGQGYVLPFFINIRNPLDLSHFDNRFVEPQEFFDWMYLLTGLTKDELDLNPMILNPTMKPIPIWMYIRNNPKMLKKLADSTVFDGIVFYEFCPNIKDVNDPAYSTKAYIIFNPEDAKLADPNRGNLMLASLKSFLLKRGGKI